MCLRTLCCWVAMLWVYAAAAAGNTAARCGNWGSVAQASREHRGVAGLQRSVSGPAGRRGLSPARTACLELGTSVGHVGQGPQPRAQGEPRFCASSELHFRMNFRLSVSTTLNLLGWLGLRVLFTSALPLVSWAQVSHVPCQL